MLWRHESGRPTDLLGELAVDDLDAFAERVMTEAEHLLGSGLSAWKLESAKQAMRVFSRPVRGTALVVTRSDDEIDAPADEVFDLMVSVKGFEIIDPATKNHHDAPVEVFDWKRGRAEVALAKAPMARPLTPREFVVLNLIDKARPGPAGAKGLFVSKSILHPRCPKAESKVRALNTFAVRTEPLLEGRCRLAFLNYIDLGGRFPHSVVNAIATKAFLQGVYGRLREHLRHEGRG